MYRFGQSQSTMARFVSVFLPFVYERLREKFVALVSKKRGDLEATSTSCSAKFLLN